MPKYEVTAPDGRMLEIEGERPPTEGELRRIFGTVGMKQETSKPEYPSWMTPFDKAGVNFPRSLGNVITNMAKGVMALPSMVGGGLQNTDPLAPEKAVYNTASTIASELVKKYGSVEKIKAVFEEDPASIMADLSMFKPSLDPTRLVTKPVGAAVGYVANKLPGAMYSSAVKLPTGGKMSLAERNRQIQTGLENAIMPTEGGLNKIDQMVSNIEGKIQPAISEAAQQGATVGRQSVANRLGDVLDRFTTQVDPLEDLGTIAAKERAFIETQPVRIPVDVAQAVKKGTYKELKGKYGRQGSAAVEAEKALARGLKEEVYSALEQQHPELKLLGEKEGALMNLRSTIEKAAQRIENQDLLPLKGAIGAATGNAPVTIAGLLELPRIKSALSIALHRANALAKKTAPIAEPISKLPPYAYGIGTYGQEGQ